MPSNPSASLGPLLENSQRSFPGDSFNAASAFARRSASSVSVRFTRHRLSSLPVSFCNVQPHGTRHFELGTLSCISRMCMSVLRPSGLRHTHQKASYAHICRLLRHLAAIPLNGVYRSLPTAFPPLVFGRHCIGQFSGELRAIIDWEVHKPSAWDCS